MATRETPTSSPFGDPYRNTPTTYTVPDGPKAGQGTDAQNDAYATLRATLAIYGLESLADWAWRELLAGKPTTQILLDLQQTDAFKARFPAIDLLLKSGQNPLTPGEYIAYENQARQMFRAAGFPPSMFDSPDDFTKYIANGVSVAELSQRAQLYVDAAYNMDAETRNALRNYYNVNEGDIAAYFADPDRALPVLQQQAKAAAVAGAGTRQHFSLSPAEAERLASMGISPDQAAQGFGQVFHYGELFQQLPGEAASGLDRQTQLGIVAGDQAAIDSLERQADKRKAQFQSGGGYSQSKTGFGGLGSAATN